MNPSLLVPKAASTIWKRVYPRPWQIKIFNWGNQPLTEDEKEAVRILQDHNRPLGNKSGKSESQKRLRIESTMQPRGRPKKK